MSYTKKTDEELKQIAKDVWAGKIFTDRHLKDSPAMIPVIFMILVLLDKKQVKKMEQDNISLIYEYFDKAAPRSINGYPTFFSMRMLDKEDAGRMIDFYNEVGKAMDKI